MTQNDGEGETFCGVVAAWYVDLHYLNPDNNESRFHLQKRSDLWGEIIEFNITLS